MTQRSGAVAAKTAKEVKQEELKAKCWKTLMPVLKLRPEGMTLDEITETLKSSDNGRDNPDLCDQRFILAFLTEMNKEHNILGYTTANHSSKSSKMLSNRYTNQNSMKSEDRVILRSKSIRTGLKVVTQREKGVYNSVEQSGVSGINTRTIVNQTRLSSIETTRIFRKLQSHQLVFKFTDPRNRRILWISKMFEDQVMAAVNAKYTPSTFRKSSGAFQSDMIDSVMTLVLPLLRKKFGGFVESKRQTFGLSDLKKIIGSLEKGTLSAVQLSQKDIESLLRLMCLNGMIEKHSTFTQSVNVQSDSDIMSSQKKKKRGFGEMTSSDDTSNDVKSEVQKEDQYIVLTPKLSVFSHIPCQSCELNDRCQIKNEALINPIHCIYLTHWLDLF